jgi:hypothetical protein
MQPPEKYALVGRYAVRRLHIPDEEVVSNTLTEVAPGIVDYFAGKLERLRGMKSTATDSLNEESNSEEKLKYMVEKSQVVLMKASAVFPFDLFPDSITIDRQKLTFVHRNFFNQEKTVSVPLADISNVQADVGPLFGTITVTSEHFINNTQTIRYLTRKEVLELQRVLQGMTIAHKEGVDLSTVSEEELLPLLQQLGKGEVKKYA